MFDLLEAQFNEHNHNRDLGNGEGLPDVRS